MRPCPHQRSWPSPIVRSQDEMERRESTGTCHCSRFQQRRKKQPPDRSARGSKSVSLSPRPCTSARAGVAGAPVNHQFSTRLGRERTDRTVRHSVPIPNRRHQEGGGTRSERSTARMSKHNGTPRRPEEVVLLGDHEDVWMAAILEALVRRGLFTVEEIATEDFG